VAKIAQNDRKLRIALVIPGFQAGGAEQIVLDLARCYMLRGHGVEILSMSNGGNIRARFLSSGVALHEFGFSRTGLTGLRWLAQYRKDGKTLFDYLKKSAFDVVHVHLNGPDIYCVGPAKSAKVEGLFYTFHNTYRQFEGRSFRKQLSRAYRKRCYGKYDRLFAVEDKVRTWVIDNRLAPAEKIATIRNGIDFGRLACIEGKDALRERYALDREDIVLLNIGSLSEQKNQANLIEAVGIAIGMEKRPIKLLIAGDGVLKEALGGLINRLRLDGRVRLLGCRDDIPQLLKVADLFVFPSLWEGLPIALLEAIGSGLPAAVSPIEAHTSLLSKGLSAFLLPSSEPQTIADGIDNFIRYRSHFNTVAQKAKNKIASEFSSERMAVEYLEAYMRGIEAKE